MFCVYLVWSTLGHRYVGKASDLKQRWHDHKSAARRSKHTSALYNAMRKYGHESFVIETLEECETEAEALRLECWWIAFLRTHARQGGLNLTKGGEGSSGHTHTDAARKKLSDIGRGKPKSPEHVAKISAALKAHQRSPEHSAKLAELNRARAKIPVSDETRAKMRSAFAWKKKSPVAREKLARFWESLSAEEKTCISKRGWRTRKAKEQVIT